MYELVLVASVEALPRKSLTRRKKTGNRCKARQALVVQIEHGKNNLKTVFAGTSNELKSFFIDFQRNLI